MRSLFRWIKHIIGCFIRYFFILFFKISGIKIGKSCMISLGAKLDLRRGSIIIGNNCTITHGCVILSHDAAAAKLNKKSEFITRIEDNVFIGVNSVILPGITIGENSIIGAGSVVTKDIPPNCIAAGNPAKILKVISQK